MCLITYAPHGRETLDMQALKTSRRSNSDGYGLAWFKEETGRWNVSKSMKEFSLEKVLARIPGDAPIVIHQRLATHGSKNLDNAHPFLIVGGTLLFHNGIISGTRADYQYATDKIGADGKKVYCRPNYSDTSAYVQDELEPLIQAAGTDFLLHKHGAESIANRIGSGNVLAICIPGNKYPVLINEDRGTWRDKLYYSNTYSLAEWRNYGAYGTHSGWDNGEEWEEYWNSRKTSYKPESRAVGFETTTSTTKGGEVVPIDVEARREAVGELLATLDPNDQKPDWMDQDEWERWVRTGVVSSS